jgi:hypothetical protein
MLHFTFTKIMQERLPLFVLLQIFGDMFGEQDVAGVSTIPSPGGRC